MLLPDKIVYNYKQIKPQKGVFIFNFMNLYIQGPLKKNIYNLMRDLGYHFQREDAESNSTEYSFVRPRLGFPRFHIYAKMDGKNLAATLHLDQKKPVYRGSVAHSGEYDGPVIQREIERIKNLIDNPI